MKEKMSLPSLHAIAKGLRSFGSGISIPATLMLLSVNGLGSEERLVVNPTIRSVTVYPDRAMITRSTNLSLKEGKYRLAFEAARPSLVETSLKGFSGSSDCLIQDIGSYLVARTDNPDPRVADLEKRIEELEAKRDALTQMTRRSEQKHSWLVQLGNFFAKLISDSTYSKDKSDLREWERSADLVRVERIAAKQARQKTDQDLAALDEKLTALRQELDLIRASNQNSLRTVEITVQCAKPATMEIGFSYMIPGASWSVSYNLHIDKENKLSMEYFGLIRQMTGEDWSRVMLNLSTANLSYGASRPRLHALTVAAREVKTKETFAHAEKAAEAGPEVGSTGGEKTEDVTVEDNGNTLAFRIPEAMTIQSGEKSEKAFITSFAAEAAGSEYRLVSLQESNPPFVNAVKILNRQNYPLLAGSIDLYRQAGFAGKSRMQYTPAGSYVYIGLGADYEIPSYRTVSHYSEGAGTFTSDKLFRTTVEVNFSNLKKSEENVVVYERIPVSETEKIKVKVDAGTTPGYSEEKPGSGLLKWTFKLKPGKSESIKLIYTVQAPKEFPGSIFGQ